MTKKEKNYGVDSNALAVSPNKIKFVGSSTVIGVDEFTILEKRALSTTDRIYNVLVKNAKYVVISERIQDKTLLNISETNFEEYLQS
jgi:hypothetical protein